MNPSRSTRLADQGALRPLVSASLFAALTAVGAYIFVPIGPVPIVLQNMFVFLSGLLLGSRWGSRVSRSTCWLELSGCRSLPAAPAASAASSGRRAVFL